MSSIARFFPGVLLLVVVGLLARVIETVVSISSVLLLALVLGFVIGNTIGVPTRAGPGVKTDTLWLEVGIILMGASISFSHIVNSSPYIFIITIITILLFLFTVETLSRLLFNLPAKVSSLIAAGASICGVSAVAAVSRSIGSSRQQVAYVAATVLLFDAVTLTVYPILGRALGLPSTVYGIWVGSTMFSTGPVAAAGFAYSDTSGEWAVLIKLFRNMLIGLIVVAYAYYYRRRRAPTVSSNTILLFWNSFPKFVIGFFVVILFSNLVFSSNSVQSLTNASNWLFLLAFAGLGLQLELAKFREAGIIPAVVMGISLIIVSSFTLSALILLF